MSNCPICKASISCACQLRTLSTGLQVCANCFQTEQNKINQQQVDQIQNQNNNP